MLSRQHMEQVIREGGSVLHEGRLITRIEQLPTEAALAKGDPAKEAAALEALQAQIAELQTQMASLQPSTQEEATPQTDTDTADAGATNGDASKPEKKGK